MIHYFYGTLQVGIGQTLCSFEHVSCYIEYCLKSLHLCTMSFTIAVRHTFATLLLSPSLTPPGAGSDHPLPDLLLQPGRLDEDEVWQSRLFRLWTYCVEQFAI